MTENFKLAAIIEGFIARKTDNEQTARTYRQELIKWLGWLQGQDPKRRTPTLAALTRENIIAYRDHEQQRVSERTGRPLSAATVSLSLAAIAAFDKAVAAHFKRPRAFVDIRVPEPEEKEIRGLTLEEFRIISDYVGGSSLCFTKQRVRLVFVLGIETALRVGEMNRIALGQYDRERGIFESVYIQKKHRPRNKIITPLLQQALDDYLPLREAQLRRRFAEYGQDWDALPQAKRNLYPLIVAMCGIPGKPETFMLKIRGVHRLMSQLGKRHKIHLHPHKLRHTSARQMITAGVDSRDVADHLAHKGMGQVMRYTKPDDAHRRNELAKREQYLKSQLEESE